MAEEQPATHWSDEPSDVAARAHAEDQALRPLPPLGVVAQRARDVSPAWEDVTIDPHDTPAAPPAVAGRDRAIGVESIREGWLLHRGQSRIASGASPDLALLVGDWCYAAGLCSIADHGSLDDVARLATLVATVSARADESIDALRPTWQQTLEAMHDA